MKTNIEYINIIDCIQEQVDKIAKIKWKEDIESPPKFIVSELREAPKIMLTIEHNGYYHTTTLFPNGDYGCNSIAYIMEQLYNSTM